MVEPPESWRAQKRGRQGVQLNRREIASRTALLLLIQQVGEVSREELDDIGRQLVDGIILSLCDHWWCTNRVAEGMRERMLARWGAESWQCEYRALIARTRDNDRFPVFAITRAGEAWLEDHMPRFGTCSILTFGGLLTI
jgi:hypothetical protein